MCRNCLRLPEALPPVLHTGLLTSPSPSRWWIMCYRRLMYDLWLYSASNIYNSSMVLVPALAPELIWEWNNFNLFIRKKKSRFPKLRKWFQQWRISDKFYYFSSLGTLIQMLYLSLCFLIRLVTHITGYKMVTGPCSLLFILFVIRFYCFYIPFMTNFILNFNFAADEKQLNLNLKLLIFISQ